jgi:lipopolysaccharide transport system ATP-binding protein
MNLPIASENSPPGNGENRPAVILEGVSVRYRAPQERIPSLKEYAIRWLKRQIRYESFWALREISLEVQPGEVLGIIGPNGAGKSTLLKTIARVLTPTSGRVYVRGQVSPLLELGAGFDPELTGRENVYLNGTLLGYSRETIAQYFDEIVEFSGLRDFIDAPVRLYSTGMYARLGFSVATFKRPEILIVDEILGVGDNDFQTRSYERILGFQAQGTTILLVSHSLSRVEEVCSRAIWIDQGKMVASGTASSVVNQYLEQIRRQESRRLGGEMAREPVWRWGNHRLEITRVRFTAGDGSERSMFHTGEALNIHLDYIAHQKIPSPVFGVGIHRQDGVHVTGPNTGAAGLELPDLEGSGSLTFSIKNLPLLEGLYRVSVAAHNQSDTEMYDYHDRAYPFRVDNSGTNLKEKYGLMTVQGEWSFQTTHRVSVPQQANRG